MPKLSKKLTDTVARSIAAPAAGYQIHWCKETPGFGLRVSATGDRAYVLERRLDGKTVRRTLGKAAGRGAISDAAARRLQIDASSALQQGNDPLVEKRERRQAEQADALTFADALKQYVKGKRRGKDGLPLKERTKADYLAMIEPGGTRKNGQPFADGLLHALADVPAQRITAAHVRDVYEAQAKRSQRQAVYAMQVLRAVLNWHGIAIPDSPLARGTAGKDRVILAPTTGKPQPIPPEKLRAWWAAASTRQGDAADGLRFMLLTGCRPGEVFGSAYAPGLLVRDVDLAGGRVTLPDTKNRSTHTVMLSTQALEIVKAHCAGKSAKDKVFDVVDVGRTLDAINATAKVDGITPHKLRHTFGSVAEELVSGYALKRMLNHAASGDVTGAHYIGKSESQLRDAWQTVADFIAGPAPRVGRRSRTAAGTSG